ncbi:hypothetical protein [Reichenbachiella sp.]|uniref:hypothetical protein n=1 Tax=Reichenbachiella sp. TaxID=2184521 RepID=UPI003BAECBE4
MMDPLVRYVTSGLPPDYVFANILISIISLLVLIITLSGFQSFKVNVVFSGMLLLIFGYYWISRDGLVSTSDINLVAFLSAVTAFNRRKELKVVLLFSYAFIAMLVILWLGNAELLKVIERRPVFDIYKYQFVVVLFTIFMIYWVRQYHTDRASALKKTQLISAKIEELAAENEALELQQQEQEQTNEHLEQLVIERKERLTVSNEQISSFLDVNSNQIAPTVEELLQEIKYMESQEKELVYADWLQRSGEKLKEAFVSVKMSYSKWSQK